MIIGSGSLNISIMKNKYFKDSHKWQPTDVNTTGLPRPYANTKYLNKYKPGLAKIVPIPWQSEDLFNSRGHLGLNKENEGKIYKEDLCGYCGLKINDSETTTRWVSANLDFIKEKRKVVKSDIHPFHTECMKEARIFCPHMKFLLDEDFEVGLYKNLKLNAINDLKKVGVYLDEKIIQKDL
jgi:hypothetical protein